MKHHSKGLSDEARITVESHRKEMERINALHKRRQAEINAALVRQAKKTERFVASQKEITERLLRTKAPTPAGAERALLMGIRNLEESQKLVAQSKKTPNAQMRIDVASMWERTVRQLENSFIGAHEAEIQRLKDTVANVHDLAAQLQKTARIIYGRAEALPEGSVLRSALYKAFASWQSAAGTADRWSRTRHRGN